MNENWEALLDARYTPLSPLYAVHCKLFVCQLRTLPVASKAAGIYELNGHAITRTEVLGVVVRRDVKEGRMLFVLDDSTGLIEVLVWERRFEREQTVDWDTIQLGGMLRVRGKLSCYLDAPQLTLSSFDVLPDGSDGILEEIEHWKQVARLNETAYCRSTSASPEGTEALMEERAMLKATLSRSQVPQTEMECMCAVFLALSESQSGTMSEAELRDVVCSDAKMVRAALLELCDNGAAYWGQEESVASVTQIRPEGNLAEAIDRVISESNAAGITVPQLAMELKQDYRWHCVRSEQMEAALEHLTTESAVFNDGEGLYKKVV